MVDVSVIADYIQIFMFVVSICSLIGASVSKKLRNWFKSIISECLHDLLNKSNKKDNEK